MAKIKNVINVNETNPKRYFVVRTCNTKLNFVGSYEDKTEARDMARFIGGICLDTQKET